VKNKYLAMFFITVITAVGLYITGYVNKMYTYFNGNQLVLNDMSFDLSDGCYQSMVLERWYNGLIYDEGYLESIRILSDSCESNDCYFDIRLAKAHEIEVIKNKDIGSNGLDFKWDDIHLLKESHENNMYYAKNSQVLMFTRDYRSLNCISRVNRL